MKFFETHGQDTAGEALPDVVVGVSGEVHGHAAREPGAEGLPRVAAQVDGDGARGQPLLAEAAADLVRQLRARRAVRVLDLRINHYRFACTDTHHRV